MRSDTKLATLALVGLLAVVLSGSAHAQGAVTSNCHYAGAKCGLMRADGTFVVEPRYDYISAPEDGYAVYGQDGKYGLINTAGKVVIEAVYQDMELPQQGYVITVRDGRHMAMNLQGELAVPPAYDIIHVLGEGYFLAGNRIPGTSGPYQADWAVYDARAGRAVALAADNLFALSSGAYPLRFVMGDRMTGFELFAHNGERMLSGIEEVVHLQDPLYELKKNGKYGAVDREGRLAVPFEYDDLDTLEDRPEYIMAGAVDPLRQRRRRLAAAGMTGVRIGPGDGEPAWMDSNGVITREADCSDGLRLLRKGRNQVMIIDRDGTPVPRAVWDYAALVCDRPSLVARDGRYGYVDRDGSLIGDHLYYAPGKANFRDGFSEVWMARNRLVVLDSAGQRLLGPLDVNRSNFYARYPDGMTRELLAQARVDPEVLRFNEYRYCPADAVTIHRRGLHYVFRDVTGEVLARGEFEDVDCFDKGLAWVGLPYPKRWCQMDKRGQLVEGSCRRSEPEKSSGQR